MKVSGRLNFGTAERDFEATTYFHLHDLSIFLIPLYGILLISHMQTCVDGMNVFG